MNRINRPRLTIILVILFSGHSIQALSQNINRIRWDHEKIAPGLVWKHTHSIVNDSLLQNINLLEINTRRREVSLNYDPSANHAVNDQVAGSGAIAAVNAGFFNIKEGGSVTYIRVDGLVLDTDTSLKWKRVPNMNGSILIDNSGEVFIGSAKTNRWYDDNLQFPFVLVTGPLLISNGEKAVLPESSLVINRHPRSAAGKKRKHKIILLTLDGRTDQAMGMTLPELSALMLSLKCSDAVNLDGGGSTTMWINGKPFRGIVNMPCDNKVFDHEGARAVSDILIIK